jgi:DNA-binding NarL/FixJ family response regulator
MPRPLRQPNDQERAELDIIWDINETIQKNIERNNRLATDRRERVRSLLSRSWSMYGVARETGITPNTIKRIVTSGESDEN